MAIGATRAGVGARVRRSSALTLWTGATAAVVALVLLPLVAIFAGVVSGGSETWQHLASTVLWDYVVHSALLVAGVGSLTLVMGVSTAWLVTTCEFPGRSWLEWALVLPLAVPTYIIAYVYAALAAHTGPLQRTLQLVLEPATTATLRSSIMSPTGAGVLMALVLYPYVYLITRASFLKQSGGILESSRILGKSPWQTFSRVALPMARPAVAAGVTLVLMEVLNEYGAVRYFAVPTFTTGIFRAWFALGDPSAAFRLSGCLLLFVFVVILLERVQRGRARFDDVSGRARPITRYHLSGWRRAAALGACLVPVVFGFLVPLGQLLAWAIQVAPQALDRRFVGLAANSFGLGLGGAIVTVTAALLIAYSVRLAPTRLLKLLERASSLGYAIPGAVIAVGVLVPFVWIDRQIAAVVQTTSGLSVGLVLTGTVAALLFAYLVRFLAVALNPIESGFERTCRDLDESSRSLGAPPMKTLLKVDIPLLTGTLASAALLVFVDVLKELPLTLILRPFDFDTLATRAFQLAMDEQVASSSLPALLIILTGMVPVLLLSRITGRDQS